VATRSELSDAYQAVSSRLIATAGQAASNLFKNLPDYRDADRDFFIKTIDAQLAGTKKQAANLAVAFYREIAKIDGEKFVAPRVPMQDLSTKALRNGADAEKVYSRPFVDLYTALSKGSTMSEAIEKGAFRATDLARTEVQLARRNAGLISRKGNNNIVGYLRTLSGAENCALCYVASTQRYTRGDLLPIHPGCDCGEMPIYGNTDTGQIIDQERLDATHQAINDRFGRFDLSAREIDYRQIQIREHGELGPVLTVKGQHFTGPNDI
jgi:hypothetical protein